MFTKKDLNQTLRATQKTLLSQRKRLKINAQNETLGRLAVKIANLLIWKRKATYADFWDAGDHVIVENVEKISVTGNKLKDKIYYTYSGYKGNVKSITMKDQLVKHPERVLYHCVRWMLPKNKLRDLRMKRLKLIVWPSTSYDHLVK